MIEELLQRIVELENRLNYFERSDRYSFQKNLQLNDGRNIQVGQTTGTKIGTAATQKLSFYGKAPVARFTAANHGAFSVGTGATITDTSKWPMGIGGGQYTIGDVVECLQAYGLLA